MGNRLILASESPRRQELLLQAGIPFQTMPAHAEETASGQPEEVALQNAVAKASAVHRLHPAERVLGADTIVVIDGVIFGKPADAAEAAAMLRRLGGRWHQVYTGVALLDERGRTHTACDVTRVHFIPLSDGEIASYIATGEPFGKAGAYAIQGRGGSYIDRIEGSFSNVIGLPLTTVRMLLRQADSQEE